MNEKIRAILIDWLLEVHIKFELNLGTLYLTVNLDRFLSVKVVTKRELQLVGISVFQICRYLLFDVNNLIVFLYVIVS